MTAVLIIFEMTHQFAVVPGLMLATLVSQVLSRSFGRVNFYDAVLLQDGHEMRHVIPPRDLRTWQNLPVSAIANFRPVAILNQDEATLRAVLEKHPYRYFPVVEEGTLKGIASRREIEIALTEHRALRLEPGRTCTPEESIRESQAALIESTTGTIAITRDDDGRFLGFLTLHDLLRSQVAMSEREPASE